MIHTELYVKALKYALTKYRIFLFNLSINLLDEFTNN